MVRAIIEIILAILPYLAGAWICNCIVMLSTCHAKIAGWKICAIYGMKYLLLNILFEIVFRYQYGGTVFYMIAEHTVFLSWFVVMVLMHLYMFKDKIEKQLLMVFVSDIIATAGQMTIGYVAGRMVNCSISDSFRYLGINTIFTWVGFAIYNPLVYFIGRKWFKKLRSLKIKYKKLLWCFFLTFHICALAMINKTSGFDGNIWVQMLGYIVFFVILLVCGAILFQRMEQNYLRKENQSLLLQQQLLEEYTISMQEQMEITRKLRHDISNHIQTLDNLAEICQQQEEFSDYASSLRRQCQLLQRTVYCSNIIINAVVCNKVRVCREKGIEAVIEIKSLELGNIPETDILGIFYNLFDNAIESCGRVEGSQKRFIHFTSDNIASQLILKMKNSSDPKTIVSRNNGKLVTAKKDKTLHGIGMSIIEDTVKAHNGTLTYRTEEKVFEIMAVLETEDSEI